ncbi:lipoprotein [Streptomyces halobius]|uniref:Lipoprotein n=1 Tax=Streptomyces halobius TaxID=2879846 RepID=A0ABY4MMM3_9ACTN|nr:lipoprotein [Streptomyces halobius]UQA97949.1 lipoprotein [Streptomyces halobius]
MGSTGTACELPVSFDVEKGWKPTGISAEDAELFGSFLGRKSARGACEIDAKPAGMIGFMRVWITDRTDDSPRQVLKTFMSEEKNVTERKFNNTKAGDLPAAEVVYTTKSPLLDEPKQERALAVTTPKDAVIVHLGGLDTDEHKEMLPAYERAKKTMTPTD